MTKISKFLLSLSFLLSVLFIAAPASSADNDGEWQSARSGDPFDPDTFSFSPRAVAVYSEPLQEGEAFRISRPGNHNKVGHRIYVVSESAFKATGLTIGEYIQTGAVNYEMATLLWVNRDIDHDGNTAFWRAGFKPAGWNPQWTSFNRDLRGTDEPLHFFMFDNTVWYSEGSTHEPDVTSLRLDDMDAHGYSDPIMFFGYAHKRNDQTNIINAGVAPTGDKFSIVDVNLDNDCDGISNWEDPDDNSVSADGSFSCDDPEYVPVCTQNVCEGPDPAPPVVPAPTTSSTTSTTTTEPEAAPASTSTTTTSTSTTTTEPEVEEGESETEPPPEPPPKTDGTTTTISEDPEPPGPTPPPAPTEPLTPTTTEPLSTTAASPELPAFSPGPEECDCDNGMPWWFWFIIGNMSWMTVRYIIKHMKKAEEEKEEVASLLDEKEDEEVE